MFNLKHRASTDRSGSMVERMENDSLQGALKLPLVLQLPIAGSEHHQSAYPDNVCDITMIQSLASVRRRGRICPL